MRSTSSVGARLATPLAVVSGCLLSVVADVSANPIVVHPPRDSAFMIDDPAWGITWLLVLNLVVNLTLLSAGILLVAKSFGHKIGNLQDSTAHFLVRFLTCVLTITFIGAVIDFFLVTQEAYIRFSTGVSWEEGYYRVLYPDLLNWFLASLMIFASVVAASALILRLFLRHSLPIAAFITCVNPVWWATTYYYGEDVTFLMLLFGVLVAPILVIRIVKWHSNERSVQLSVDRGALT